MKHPPNLPHHSALLSIISDPPAPHHHHHYPLQTPALRPQKTISLASQYGLLCHTGSARQEG